MNKTEEIINLLESSGTMKRTFKLTLGVFRAWAAKSNLVLNHDGDVITAHKGTDHVATYNTNTGEVHTDSKLGEFK